MNRSLTSIQDIVESINRIESYTKGVDYDSFLNNQMMIDAVIRNLEVIGEAARNVSDETKSKYLEIPWKNMIGFKEYFNSSIFWGRRSKTRSLESYSGIRDIA